MSCVLGRLMGALLTDKEPPTTKIGNGLPEFITTARLGHPKSETKEDCASGDRMNLLTLKKNDMSSLASWLRSADLCRSVSLKANKNAQWDYVHIQRLETEVVDPWCTFISGYLHNNAESANWDTFLTEFYNQFWSTIDQLKQSDKLVALHMLEGQDVASYATLFKMTAQRGNVTEQLYLGKTFLCSITKDLMKNISGKIEVENTTLDQAVKIVKDAKTHVSNLRALTKNPTSLKCEQTKGVHAVSKSGHKKDNKKNFKKKKVNNHRDQNNNSSAGGNDTDTDTKPVGCPTDILYMYVNGNKKKLHPQIAEWRGKNGMCCRWTSGA